MMKYLISITILFLVFTSFSQKNYKNLKIESCTNKIGIVSTKGLSGIWNFENNKVIGLLDSSVYHYYVRRNCLIKIRPDDSLFLYDLTFSEPKLIISAKNNLWVDVANDSLILFLGKTIFLGNHTQDLENNTLIRGGFGVDVIKNEVFIIDYNKREILNDEPIKDSNGNYLIKYDSISGD